MKPHRALTLEPFGNAHLHLLAAWLRCPEVARWYPEPAGPLAWAAQPPQGGEQALIAWEGRAIGYIRWQRVDRAMLDAVGLAELPANAVDVDLLLGHSDFIDKGLGTAALEVLLLRLRVDPGIPLVGLTSSVDNCRAHRAFEKAGFRKTRSYSPPGFGPCHLFTYPLNG